jgi:tetratricopeptide (TPR) repeat protein
VRRRWSAHNARLRGDDLCDAVLKEWEGDDYVPRFRSDGSAWWMLPNPLFRAGAPRQVVEHLLLAARGGGSIEDEPSWFSGRVVEVDTVVGWVGDGRPGVYVVTGSAGTGKSAIVGRVVCLSDPVERDRLLRSGRNWRHADPEPDSVKAHGHLCGSGFLEPAEEPRNSADLLGAVQRAVELGKGTPVLVVDGLDEARGESFAIARDLLVRLGRWATVIVSARPVPSEDGTLVEVLEPAAVLDLDQPAVREAGRAALREYVESRLANMEPMDPKAVVDHVVGSTDAADRPFLLARVITDQLRARPVDTSKPGWEGQVATSIETAFRRDLELVESPRHRQLSHEMSPAQFARTLLVSLTWAFGAGFPEDEWRAVATALTGLDVDATDVSWLLDQVGRYVVQDGEAGVAVYRIAHQSLADHLRPQFQGSATNVFDPQARPVTDALLERYRALLDSGLAAREPEYLWRYGYRHAAQVGPDGVDTLRRLAEIDDDLRLDVALASTALMSTLRFWGKRTEALTPAQEAADLYRALAAGNPAFLSNLASALNNLGLCYRELGRRAEAVPPTQEAVDTYRVLVVDNAAFLPDLAMALNNLGVCYSELGRRAEAVPPTQEAVDTYRVLVVENVAFLPDLAMALNNLGLCYRELGRGAEAVPLNQEAVDTYRALAADNPAFLPGLAMTLNNLGIRYSELGRRAEALPSTQEAVGIYRALAVENPVFLPELADALNNLDSRYRELDGLDDGDREWSEAMRQMPDASRVVLLIHRSSHAEAGTPAAASWLVTALTLAGEDRTLAADVHHEARRHDDAAPQAWRHAWSEASDQPLPAWLLVDRELFQHATEWLATPTYQDEHQFLTEHPQLADDAADHAVEEALLDLPEPEAARYHQLRHAARHQGIDAAYRPLLLGVLAAEFRHASPVEQRQLLDTRRADLLDDHVRNPLAAQAAGEDATPQDVRAVAVLDLVASGATDQLLDEVYAAIEQPIRFPEILHTAATTTMPAQQLETLAQVALTTATTNQDAATAFLYAAIASADPDQSRARLEQARQFDPDHRDEWSRLLLSLHSTDPEPSTCSKPCSPNHPRITHDRRHRRPTRHHGQHPDPPPRTGLVADVRRARRADQALRSQYQGSGAPRRHRRPAPR